MQLYTFLPRIRKTEDEDIRKITMVDNTRNTYLACLHSFFQKRQEPFSDENSAPQKGVSSCLGAIGLRLHPLGHPHRRRPHLQTRHTTSRHSQICRQRSKNMNVSVCERAVQDPD